jgi:predicted metal-dependent enzyme (double-stranded beta helix superfamily)
MFDIDEFIGGCREAVRETDPRRAVRERLERAVSEPAAVAEALAPTDGGFTLLHQASDLTVLHVVWAPGMRIFPHDHQMWAGIGIYAGQEDNEFFRRSWPDRRGLEPSGGRELRERDVVLLGDDTIHAVTNPLGRLTAAIHVYGGDFVNEQRSQWGPGPVEERPYAIDVAQQQFAKANAAWRAAGAAESA